MMTRMPASEEVDAGLPGPLGFEFRHRLTSSLDSDAATIVDEAASRVKGERRTSPTLLRYQDEIASLVRRP